MRKLIFCFLGITGFLFAQDKIKEDIWEPFRYFEGEWMGDEAGKSGIGKGERSIEFIMDKTYLFYKNTSHFEPQEKNPKGETHEDWTFFSFNKNRQKYIIREFHSEGFVNQYILDSLSNDNHTFVYISENVENAPPGIQARLTYKILSKNKFKEIFELASSGKNFTVWLENIWTRKINPDPERYRESIEMFKWLDTKNSLPSDPVLFVGSSSIRLWETVTYFPGYPVINRGFGGSHISDVNYFIESLVLKYNPKVIVFYAGDNDIAFGKNIDRVFDDYVEFVKAVKTHLPQTQIIYLPIKPSIARWSLWDIMEQTNLKIQQYSNTDKMLHFVDLATPMLDCDGKPDSTLFISDGLHLNAKGYGVWSKILLPVVGEVYHEN
jgi:lysophospholipase L1-like esterase